MATLLQNRPTATPTQQKRKVFSFLPLTCCAGSVPPPAAVPLHCCSFITNMNQSCDCCEIVGCIEWVIAILLITILPVIAALWLHSCSLL